MLPDAAPIDAAGDTLAATIRMSPRSDIGIPTLHLHPYADSEGPGPPRLETAATTDTTTARETTAHSYLPFQ